MQTETVDLNEAQVHFKELMQRVTAGLHVILSEDQKPIAHIFPMDARVSGLHAGNIWTSDDFDAPLTDDLWSGSK